MKNQAQQEQVTSDGPRQPISNNRTKTNKRRGKEERPEFYDLEELLGDSTVSIRLTDKENE